MNRTLLNEQNESSVITFAERPGVEFRISEKEIGRGASCIVYHAVGSDNTEHLLKEYYPKHLELIRDSSGQIVVPEDKNEVFEQGLVRFRTGCERQKSIRLSNEGLKNFTCNVQGYYAANGTEYIDMTCFNGQTYDHVQEKSVYNLILRMRTLAQVVGNYHKAGLLHLDIKPENIYVRPEGETIEDVMLFDFDSVTPMNEIITSKALSCTKTWAAPEQLLPEKRKSICPATDLFAIGEIIFFQLFGRHSTSTERRSFVTKYTYDHNAEIFKDMNPKVFPLLDDLLCHTICGVVGKRYQSADELIEKLAKIIKIANPDAPYLKSSLPAVQDFFVGRENEIEEIHHMLNENQILFLNGIGGIGKSELAKHYALEHKDDYDTVIFAPYVSDVKMLLQDDTAIPLYNFSQYPEEKPEEYCARKLRKLQELCDERTLFIVDNLDCEDDPNLNKLLTLGCKLLITTRVAFSDYGYGQQLYLDALADRGEIRKIFDEYYTKPLTEEENGCVEQIIDLVAGHTMTVELLAKQMVAGRVKPDKMLAKLQGGAISESGKEKVHMGKDGNFSSQSAYDHIKALFDLSDLNEDEKYILANLSQIPYTGIPAELFHDWCELEDYGTLNSLATQGWVRWNMEKDYVSLHPVIAELCGCCQTDLSTFNVLLKNIDNSIVVEKVCTYNEIATLTPVLLNIFKKIKRHEMGNPEICEFLWHVQRWLDDNSTMRNIVEDIVEYVVMHETETSSDHHRLRIGLLISILKYNMACYKDNERCKKKLEYWRAQYKAIPVAGFTNSTSIDKPLQEKLNALSSLISYYQDMGDKEKEFDTYKKIVATYENASDSELDLLRKQEGSFEDTFFDIATAYEKIELFDKAITIHMESLNSIPNDMDSKHLWDRERVYQSLLSCLAMSENWMLQKEISHEYFEWAVRIYPQNHPKYLYAIENLLVAQAAPLMAFFAEDGDLEEVKKTEPNLYAACLEINSTFQMYCETTEKFSTYTMPGYLIQLLSGMAHMMFGYVLLFLERTAKDYVGTETPPADVNNQRAICLLTIIVDFFKKLGNEEEVVHASEFIEYIEGIADGE